MASLGPNELLINTVQGPIPQRARSQNLVEIIFAKIMIQMMHWVYTFAQLSWQLSGNHFNGSLQIGQIKLPAF